jgi:AcrR family transcriptional regulator
VRTADPAKSRRIIDAAIQLFAERPYHEVRMEDIAARAQVAKGTLYLHYQDKEDLFLGIMNDGLSSLVDRIESSLKEEMPPEEKLLAMNRESFRYFERNHFFLDVIQRVELLRFGARSVCFEETRGRLLAILTRILREFPSRAKASDEDLALEVMAHAGMMKEIVHSLPRPWPEDLPERVTRLFLCGLCGGRQERAGGKGGGGRSPRSEDRQSAPPRRRQGSERR